MTRLHRKSVEAMTQSRGLKMTPQRRVIVDYLQSATHHPTADEVLNAVNRRFPMTSRVTVYNTLNWLKEAGMVREVFEGGCVRFDPNTSEHHHFICRKCGGVEDIEDIGCSLVGKVSVGMLSGCHKVEKFECTV